MMKMFDNQKQATFVVKNWKKRKGSMSKVQKFPKNKFWKKKMFASKNKLKLEKITDIAGHKEKNADIQENIDKRGKKCIFYIN